MGNDYVRSDISNMPSNDWGDSFASFAGFDIAIEHAVEKTTRVTKFLSEKAAAQIEYAKKLREIAQKHQQKYNQKPVALLTVLRLFLTD